MQKNSKKKNQNTQKVKKMKKQANQLQQMKNNGTLPYKKCKNASKNKRERQ